jgi:hypothetical protein
VLATSRETQELQSSARATTQQLAKNARLNGSVVIEVELGAGGNTTRHPLGRIPQGWLIVDATGGVPAVYRQAWDEETISLVSSTDNTIKLEIW